MPHGHIMLMSTHDNQHYYWADSRDAVLLAAAHRELALFKIEDYPLLQLFDGLKGDDPNAYTYEHSATRQMLHDALICVRGGARPTEYHRILFKRYARLVNGGHLHMMEKTPEGWRLNHDLRDALLLDEALRESRQVKYGAQSFELIFTGKSIYHRDLHHDI